MGSRSPPHTPGQNASPPPEAPRSAGASPLASMIGGWISPVLASQRDYGNKGKHLIGAGLQFRGLIHYHGGMQADTVLEKEPRVLYLDLQTSILK
ncbi:hypothetical protein I79_024306 [Cricetulus griseus]|uniref:Uncharacterized protein n=1 Tax=Cricetulus griseus TaxID=10029 RepID=G3IKA7_CRIGR|nr:hypothetical protein I79_024306 [Cricetulus griseus]